LASIPSLRRKAVSISDRKLGMLSDLITLGIEVDEKNSISLFAIVSALQFGSGKASTHFEFRQTIVNRCLFLRAVVGKSLRMSISISWNG